MQDELAKGQVARLEIQQADGELIRVYSTKPDKALAGSPRAELPLKIKSGVNEVRWNLSYPSAESFKGVVLWGGGTGGPRAVPGTYRAVLSIGEESQEMEFELQKDPRSSASVEDLQAQFDFLVGVRDKLSEVHSSIKKLRDVRSQIEAFKVRLKKDAGDSEDHAELIKKMDEMVTRMTAVEKELYQVQNRSAQDPLNFPIKLNNRLSALVSVVANGDNAPTRQSGEVRDLLIAEIDEQLATLEGVLGEGVNELNAAIRGANIPAIFMENPGK
jgi:hypothetical protein